METTPLSVPDTAGSVADPPLSDGPKREVSIIVPTLNEETRLPACLDSVAAQEPPFETVVVDGGSSDATREIASQRGARVLRVARGRARQMNRGAQVAKGDVLLFLHADTVLPDDALAQLRQAVSAGVDAGAFHLVWDSRRPAYRLAAALANLYCRATGDCFGDRAIFATREAFDRVGGYRPLRLMEDLDLTVRLRRGGYRVALLPGRVVTSARRFERLGVLRGGWWAWRLCRAFHRRDELDLTAERFYVDNRR